MRVNAIAIVLTLLILAGCSDDPIIGPTDGDTSGGGSYGVIHFETSPDGQPAKPVKKENPKRF